MKAQLILVALLIGFACATQKLRRTRGRVNDEGINVNYLTPQGVGMSINIDDSLPRTPKGPSVILPSAPTQVVQVSMPAPRSPYMGVIQPRRMSPEEIQREHLMAINNAFPPPASVNPVLASYYTAPPPAPTEPLKTVFDPATGTLKPQIPKGMNKDPYKTAPVSVPTYSSAQMRTLYPIVGGQPEEFAQPGSNNWNAPTPAVAPVQTPVTMKMPVPAPAPVNPFFPTQPSVNTPAPQVTIVGAQNAPATEEVKPETTPETKAETPAAAVATPATGPISTTESAETAHLADASISTATNDPAPAAPGPVSANLVEAGSVPVSEFSSDESGVPNMATGMGNDYFTPQMEWTVINGVPSKSVSVRVACPTCIPATQQQ